MSDAGQSVDEPAVTFASMESLLHRMLSPLTASVEALRESNVQMLASQNALTTRVDSMDLTIKRHSERLEVVEGQLGAQAAAAGRKVSPPRVPSPKPAQPSYADAASAGGSYNTGAPGHRPTPKASPGPSSSAPAQSAQLLRIEFLGLHDFERRYEDALDAKLAHEFLTKVYEGLPSHLHAC